MVTLTARDCCDGDGDDAHRLVSCFDRDLLVGGWIGVRLTKNEERTKLLAKCFNLITPYSRCVRPTLSLALAQVYTYIKR